MAGADQTAACPRFGRYHLIRRVSVGGMAEVYKAKAYGEAGFEKVVALKRLLPTAEEDPELVALFVAEARLATRLDHPRVCRALELGRVRSSPYLAMEYLYGHDLRAIQRRLTDRGVPMEPEAAAAIGWQVAEGLAYAHGLTDEDGRPMGVVHRDLSPRNLILSPEGRVRIVDFGIAKFEGRGTDTEAGGLRGTHAYMSPEQVRHEPVDARTDLFALAVVLHELLSGERLFKRATTFETLEAVEAAVAPPLPDHVPGDLRVLIAACLSRDRDRRPASAELVASILRGVLRGAGQSDPEPPLAELYRELFGREGAREDEVTLDEYRAALRAAAHDGDRTERRSVADATVVVDVPDSVDLETYVRELSARLPGDMRAPPGASRRRARPPSTAPRVSAVVFGWALAVAALAFVLASFGYYVSVAWR